MDTNSAGAVTVLVVDDNPFNLSGLVLYLQSRGYGTLEAGDQRTAIELAAHHMPPLAVVDIMLPATPLGPVTGHLNLGLEVVRVIKHMNPNIGVVIFSAHEDRGSEVWNMVQDGMRGIAYVLKGSPPERIIEALTATAAGEVVLEPDYSRSPNQLAQEMRARLTPEERPWVERAEAAIPTLSPRETTVAWRMAASHTNQSIAEYLGLAPKTIETYTANIYDKLGFKTLDAEATSLRKSTLLAKACMLYQLTHKRR